MEKNKFERFDDFEREKKSLTELVKEGYRLLEEIPKGIAILYKGRDRIFYDSKTNEIIWRYKSSNRIE